jgi:hypothetical protein
MKESCPAKKGGRGFYLLTGSGIMPVEPAVKGILKTKDRNVGRWTTQPFIVLLVKFWPRLRDSELRATIAQADQTIGEPRIEVFSVLKPLRE